MASWNEDSTFSDRASDAPIDDELEQDSFYSEYGTASSINSDETSSQASDDSLGSLDTPPPRSMAISDLRTYLANREVRSEGRTERYNWFRLPRPFAPIPSSSSKSSIGSCNVSVSSSLSECDEALEQVLSPDEHAPFHHDESHSTGSVQAAHIALFGEESSSRQMPSCSVEFVDECSARDWKQMSRSKHDNIGGVHRRDSILATRTCATGADSQCATGFA
eukprot:TRINITY_DN24436_c0_g1_i1.p1 TRINITY_DN24436_c0_g1~~TRINITY_DN24436_c0_g1_i1.p1  ORF type:complete len:221 (+),score=13.50 TRINITY_DN24436_c0_g1_i1:202-864(+)